MGRDLEGSEECAWININMIRRTGGASRSWCRFAWL